MKKSKKLLSLLLLSITFACASLGGFLLSSNDIQNISYAQEDIYDQISNSLPKYLSVKKSETLLGLDDIFLFSTGNNENVTITIGEKEITGTDNKGATIKNYGYYEGQEAGDNFMYFSFSNSLSLYHDVTNNDLANGVKSTNLIEGQEIGDFAKQYESNGAINGGIPENLSITPQKLNVKLKFDLTKKNVDVTDDTITLNKEGCYTLSIPTVIYETENGGETFTSRTEIINFTFMAVNYSTYFNQSTKAPNIQEDANNMQASTPIGGNFSKYYFYSYSSKGESDDLDDLPTLTFNPKIYQINITYTDTNQRTKNTRIEYSLNKFTQYDENGDVIDEADYFVWTNLTQENEAKLIFNDLGTYDLNITYLYQTKDGKIYNLPLDKLPSAYVNNKLQRVYVYGIQAFYSNYNEIDPSTNQPVAGELKTLDIENAKFSNSADITTKINDIQNEAQSNPHQGGWDSSCICCSDQNECNDKNCTCLLCSALAYLNTNGTTIASTNQTPVKFVNNIEVDSDNTSSAIYPLSKDADGKWVAQTQQNISLLSQNKAGTYLYIVQYTFSEFTDSSGGALPKNNHYQVFCFEITNKAPSVTLYSGTESATEQLYTRGYTNKSVFIVDNSSKSPYDAKVSITITAKDYNTGNILLSDRDISSFKSTDIKYYENFNTIENENKSISISDNIAGQSGLHISNTSDYASCNFTIKITATNMTRPSITTFTIDTTDIQNMKARKVYEATSSNYAIGDAIPQTFTNENIILSWDEKNSGAPTYGYLKYIPLESMTYNVDENTKSSYLATLMEQNLIPVNYSIDMGKFSSANWVEYKNSDSFTSLISASYVRQNSGFYLLEVYDEAGNSNFELFMIDKTSPLFIKNLQQLDDNGEVEGEIRSFISSGENIDVPEEINYKICIEWANKGIYIDNLSALSSENLVAFAYTKDKDSADTKLKEKLQEFANSDYITTLSGAYVTSGNYLKIDMNDTYYSLASNGDNYVSSKGNSYDVSLFKQNEDGSMEADESSHSILIRDKSNTKVYGDEGLNYRNAPSAFLNFRVTSDASKLDIKVGEKPAGDENWSALQWSNYSFTGFLDGDNKPMGAKDVKSQSISTNKYKYSYILPTNNSKKLTLTYVPRPSNGSIVESITLTYYKYEKTSTTLNGNAYFYYTLSENATRSFNIYTDGSGDVDKGAEQTFEIILGENNYPIAGRYIIERTYKQESSVGKFDYFKRTLTFIVDPYNVISPIESVEATITDDDGNQTTNTSLESIVGGDILLSLYSGANNTNLEISFPKYTNGLNQGSFYTNSSFVDEQVFPEDQISLSGNKLPISLLIPQYKYTEYATKDSSSIYSVETNNDLSYFARSYVEEKIDGKETKYNVYRDNILIGSYSTQEEAEAQRILADQSIAVYSLYAKVEYFAEGAVSVTERYHGGNIDALLNKSNTYSNGYMKLFKQTSSLSASSTTLTLESTPTEQFTSPGEYVVTIYQANNRGASFDQLYSLYKFAFYIENNAPEFEIIDSNGYSLEEREKLNGTTGVYYTNSSKLKIQWEIPKSEYIALIDEATISISGFKSTTIETDEINGDNVAGGTRYFEYDASEIIQNLLKNPNATNNYIEVTMQFIGHNEAYYDKTTKRIYFDITAPQDNILTLMKNVESSSMFKGSTSFLPQTLLHEQAREYHNYKNELTTFTNNGNGISYSYMQSSGTLKYYYYNVSSSFISSLKLDNSGFGAKFIGIKEVDDLENYTQTDKDSFNENKFTQIDEFEGETGLYEVVERDWAGNMTVYLVNIPSLSDDDRVLSYKNNKGDFEFTNADMTINSNNIYSNTGFEITEISYHNDGWEVFSVTKTGGITNVYMKSPWLNEGIYLLNGDSFESATLSNLFAGATSSNRKHTIAFANRDSGTRTNLYVTIYNASLVTSTSYTTPQAELDILNLPSKDNLASSTYGYVYPVKIQVLLLKSGEYTTIATLEATSGLYGTWTKTGDMGNSVTLPAFKDRTLYIKTTLSNAGEKLKYIITDNFGNTSTVIQLTNIEKYDEISGNGSIYEMTENDNSKTYISDNTISFKYHQSLYEVKVYDESGKLVTQSASTYTTSYANNITTYTFSNKNKMFTLKITDVDDTETLRTIHLRIYDTLPKYTQNLSAENEGVTFLDRNASSFDTDKIQTKRLTHEISIDGKTFYSPHVSYISTYSSVVTMSFTNSPTENENDAYYERKFSYSAYISKDDGNTFTKITSQDGGITSYALRGAGDYLIFFVYDDENVLYNSYSAYMITIWDSNSSKYTITIDGEKVERCDLVFTDNNNQTYEINYLVGIDYSNKNRVVITPNEELGVVITLQGSQTTGTDVYVEIYSYSCTESSGSFAVLYIKPNNDFITQFSYESPSGTSDSLLGKQSETIVAKESDISYDKLKITFTPYYGISSNRIHLKVEKMFEGNFIDVSPDIDYSQSIATTYITRAGYYRISLHDSCEPANYQSFSGGEYMYLYFLNSVPFVVTSLDENGASVTTEQIANAIYNSRVTLKLTNLSTFYSPSGYPEITVYRNGQVYSKGDGTNGYTESNYTFTFSQPGYYQVSFSATSRDGIQIRTTTFGFMILSKNESRSAFNFPTYSRYYIVKIEKEGLGDITQEFMKYSSSDEIISVNGNDYLSALTLSHLDEKTGSGRYTITICPNEDAYASVGVTDFTFNLWINSSIPPLNVSISEGEATTNTILVSFNAQNFYDTVGDSYIKIGSKIYEINETTLSTYEEITSIKIDIAGTYYIQVYTASGQLLYSYKAIKNDPLNAFAVIAIVVGVIAIIIVIAITIRLRKRQKIK